MGKRMSASLVSSKTSLMCVRTAGVSWSCLYFGGKHLPPMHSHTYTASADDVIDTCCCDCVFCVKVRSPGGSDSKVRVFDAQHERRRKEQLEKLFHRTEEQVGFCLRAFAHFTLAMCRSVHYFLPCFIYINVKTQNMGYEYASCMRHRDIFLHLFWHAPLGVRSAIHRHQPAQRAVLSHVNCLVKYEVVGFRSRWTVFSHVIQGCPGGVFQFCGGGPLGDITRWKHCLQ